MSEDFEDFLATYCNIDADLAVVGEYLRGALGEFVRSWLPAELTGLVARPYPGIGEDLAYATGRSFPTDADAVQWLQGLLRSWFG